MSKSAGLALAIDSFKSQNSQPVTLSRNAASRLASSPSDEVAGIAPFVELLISVRARLRAAKNWSAADEIRDGLSGLGIILEDDAEETAWRRR